MVKDTAYFLLDFSAYDNITNDELNIIHAKKSILIHKQQAWQKKGDTTFDVTMGSYDGAETCELVGSFLLSQLQHLDVNIGRYRDDGLAISNAAPRETENIKKEICRVFNQNGLRITIEANKQIINFLDVTFNLNNSSYRPFTKPNTTLQYVHRESNHPPITTRTYPPASTDGYHPFHRTKHHSTKPPPRTKMHSTTADTTTLYTTNRPQLLNGETDNATTSSGTTPHSAKNVNTNIGHRFLALVDKHFPKANKLRKIFNRNTIKISYRCMNNTKQIIDNHNKRIQNVSKHTDKSTDNSVDNKSCNCRQKKLMLS